MINTRHTGAVGCIVSPPGGWGSGGHNTPQELDQQSLDFKLNLRCFSFHYEVDLLMRTKSKREKNANSSFIPRVMWFSGEMRNLNISKLDG